MKGLVTPIAPSSVLFLIQAGYAADFIMLMTVDSINGLNNYSIAPARANPGDPEFFQVVELLRKVQRSGEIGMRVEVDKAKKETTLVTFRRRAVDGSPPVVPEHGSPGARGGVLLIEHRHAIRARHVHEV